MVMTIRCLAIVMGVAILCSSLASAAARKKLTAKDCKEKCDSSSDSGEGSCFKAADSDELINQQISKKCGQCMGMLYCNAGKCTTKSCDKKRKKKKRKQKEEEGEERQKEIDDDNKKKKKKDKKDKKDKKEKEDKKEKPDDDSDESDDSDYEWDIWPCNRRKHEGTSSR